MLLAELAHQWRTRLAQPTAMGCLLLYTLTLACGAVNGRLQRDAQLDGIATHRASVAAAMRTWRAAADDLEHNGVRAQVPPWAASPMDVRFAATLPPAPLADFAIGQADLLPYAGSISLWDPDIRLFARYELDDPVALALGGLDLTKAITLLLPIVLIVLCFDVLAAERDAQRLALAVVQGMRPRNFVWYRLSIRSTPALALTFGIALIAACVHGEDTSLAARLAVFGPWVATVFLYGAFWVAAIGLFASIPLRSEATLLVLLIGWTALVFILPGSVAGIAAALYPPPSRAAYLAEAREVEIETELSQADLTRQFVLDHSDQQFEPNGDIPAYFRVAYLATTAVDRASAPTLAAFDDAAHQRDSLLHALQYISPAIIVQQLSNHLAGSATDRQRAFVAAALELKRTYAKRAGRYIMIGQRLPPDEIGWLSTVTMAEEPPQATLAGDGGAIAFLVALTVLLACVADRRLRRVNVLD